MESESCILFPDLLDIMMPNKFAILQPNIQYKPQKEGTETEQFWGLLGGKCDYSNQKIVKEPENDPHLFYCDFSKGTC